jgi:hypothetical protein
MLFTKATHCEKSLEYARPPRITTLFAPALRTACRSEAMSATLWALPAAALPVRRDFDVTYLRRRSEIR